ncbi:RNA-binding S4 domain-containing protein [Metamycoplasma hyosynoviae]|uniref:RNA-binding S4 domain-containing protein n=1 Tax=Metamycoplasma hyosynoviae TaxID=29559 RepID=UPI0004613279|nr:RNA-binding S4 domain-containing protein [Metamycoplasma hyosynoviae]KDE45581.1 RNA-binding protein [Metamycoplasma hyosynoviae]MDC8915767.1 RNA-binding S4 domain-containing protein [Metamycoplasma hyosynoviae]MDC8920779.1 RNA-binding S4 domain-containing protein [Metamycoplasma hyosynoviae]MDD1372386.1 RNA-binding S4 domain-containing protein [Metamycoplasma hyosynoviae]MDD1372779.1 RNA-binding S4 domain-containing protein [Metamycoplasma hyosynoviae]
MEIEIYGDSIKVSQFLKKIGITDTGGKAKFFLKAHKITVNGEQVSGRNAKIRPGDTVWIDDSLYKIIASKMQ